MKPTKQIYFCLQSFLEESGKKDLQRLIRIKKNWGILIGQRLAGHSEPYIIQSGCLTVKVRDRAYAEAMEFRKKEVLAYLKILLGGKFIRDLRFLVSDSLEIKQKIKTESERINKIPKSPIEKE